MPDYGKRTGRDLVESLERRISASERELRRLRGGGLSTMDRGDTLTQPAPVEGQTMIQYDSDEPWYFANGVWRDFCCMPAAAGFADTMTEIAQTTTLLGWWRLGEAASPFADTSGYVGGPADMTRQILGTAMTTDVPGALAAGDDDGAVRFNAGLWTTPDLETGDWLTTGTHPYLTPSSSVTLACFLRPAANAGVWRGHAFGNFTPNPVAGYPGGHAVFVDWPARELKYIRAQSGSSSTTWAGVTGGNLAADTWVFVVASYDAATGTIKLYLDGALVDTDTFGVSVTTGTSSLAIGRSSQPPADYAQPPDFLRPAFFKGAVDEASVWGGVLTAGEVARLYDAAVGGGAVAGQVLASDGAGGTSWEYPLTVWVNGA